MSSTVEQGPGDLRFLLTWNALHEQYSTPSQNRPFLKKLFKELPMVRRFFPEQNKEDLQRALDAASDQGLLHVLRAWLPRVITILGNRDVNKTRVGPEICDVDGY